ncbi:MAG: adenosylmethionine decarboxylase [Chloroflexi bacterium]|nr:adenosylmethionine decarboxylase [Chloroflexota bacterium]MCL5076402.1 adenosylmethionine decarboxylase [Chloroflexota bacterium]
MHLVLDGRGGDYQKLQDLTLIYNILEELPGLIGMTKIMPPYVFRYEGTRVEDGGISGFVLIAESHISIHTFPERHLVNMDVFSCKEFDPEKMINYIQGKFGLQEVERYILRRGLEYLEPLSTTIE